MSEKTLAYPVKDKAELTKSYMPFVVNGGIFIPTTDEFSLGDKVLLELQLPDSQEINKIEGRVVWITPQNALNNIYPGVGIQFVGQSAKGSHDLIKKHINSDEDLGSYTYGKMSDDGTS